MLHDQKEKVSGTVKKSFLVESRPAARQGQSGSAGSRCNFFSLIDLLNPRSFTLVKSKRNYALKF